MLVWPWSFHFSGDLGRAIAWMVGSWLSLMKNNKQYNGKLSYIKQSLPPSSRLTLVTWWMKSDSYWSMLRLWIVRSCWIERTCSLFNRSVRSLIELNDFYYDSGDGAAVGEWCNRCATERRITRVTPNIAAGLHPISYVSVCFQAPFATRFPSGVIYKCWWSSEVAEPSTCVLVRSCSSGSPGNCLSHTCCRDHQLLHPSAVC